MKRAQWKTIVMDAAFFHNVLFSLPTKKYEQRNTFVHTAQFVVCFCSQRHLFFKKKKNSQGDGSELALKSIPHPGIFGGFGRNVFFLQYGDFIKKPEVLILLSKTTT